MDALGLLVKLGYGFVRNPVEAVGHLVLVFLVAIG